MKNPCTHCGEREAVKDLIDEFNQAMCGKCFERDRANVMGQVHEPPLWTYEHVREVRI